MEYVITCATTRSVSIMATLPALVTHTDVKEGFVNGYVADSDVHEVLELHGWACLTDYVKR